MLILPICFQWISTINALLKRYWLCGKILVLWNFIFSQLSATFISLENNEKIKIEPIFPQSVCGFGIQQNDDGNKYELAILKGIRRDSIPKCSERFSSSTALRSHWHVHCKNKQQINAIQDLHSTIFNLCLNFRK